MYLVILGTLGVALPVFGPTYILTGQYAAGGVEGLAEVKCDLITDTSFGKIDDCSRTLPHLEPQYSRYKYKYKVKCFIFIKL